MVVWQVRAARKIAVMQNTMNSIDSERRDTLRAQADIRIATYAHNLGYFEPIPTEAVAPLLEDEDALEAVWNYLNWWERVALGVNMGAYDEEMCRRRFRRVLVGTYRKYEPIILARRKTSRIYVELQDLAERWERAAERDRNA